jgi:hypothetical protein
MLNINITRSWEFASDAPRQTQRSVIQKYGYIKYGFITTNIQFQIASKSRTIFNKMNPRINRAIYLHMVLQPFFWALAPFSVSWSFTQSVGFLGPRISLSLGHYLHTGQHKHNIKTQTSMPWVGFEPTIPVFKWEKTVHALDRTGTVTGLNTATHCKLKRKRGLYLIFICCSLGSLLSSSHVFRFETMHCN